MGASTQMKQTPILEKRRNILLCKQAFRDCLDYYVEPQYIVIRCYNKRGEKFLIYFKCPPYQYSCRYDDHAPRWSWSTAFRKCRKSRSVRWIIGNPRNMRASLRTKESYSKRTFLLIQILHAYKERMRKNKSTKWLIVICYRIIYFFSLLFDRKLITSLFD